MIKNTMYDLCVGIAQDAGKFINRHVGTTHSPIKASVLAADHISNSQQYRQNGLRYKMRRTCASESSMLMGFGALPATDWSPRMLRGLRIARSFLPSEDTFSPNTNFLPQRCATKLRLTIRDLGCRSKRQPAWRKISASRRSNSADLPSERL
jgi:hypothetical protein